MAGGIKLFRALLLTRMLLGRLCWFLSWHPFIESGMFGGMSRGIGRFDSEWWGDTPYQKFVSILPQSGGKRSGVVGKTRGPKW